MRIFSLLAWCVAETLVLAVPGPAPAQAQALVPVSGGGGLEAGIVDGRPYLANQHAVYRFAKPQDGCGIISIHDRRSGRELLKVEQALLWQFDVKHPDGERSYDNVSRPCRVRSEVKDNEARLTFSWSQDMKVMVEARLSDQDALLRLKIRIKLSKPDEGLLTVTFPCVKGILPLTEGAKDDVVLGTVHFGRQYPSPLRTGEPFEDGYGRGMQFGALIGSGLGFYVAREDGTASRKRFTWTPGNDAGTIDLTVPHPVSNWGADKPVRDYVSPGDAVVGPFAGDWFDAAQIYRKWAMTAPWCRKGPIHQRDDFPQWLAKVPYFTIGYLGNETEIQNEIDKHDFYGIPINVVHTYDWFAQKQLETDFGRYFPPKLGFENFRRTVKELQDKGMMVVPYIMGELWDQDTEDYRRTNALRATKIQQDGKPRITHRYGGGQANAAMCPGTELWQQTVLEWSKELADPDRLGVAGIYYDYLTVHLDDCFGRTHGHAIGGGDSANKAICEFYSLMRTECKKLNPDVVLLGEDWAEWCIDLLDSSIEYGYDDTDAPLMQAVYHGYSLVFGTGMYGSGEIMKLGRWWLLGGQNGWTHGWGPLLVDKHPTESPDAEWARRGRYYRKLLRCHWEFARPYLAYGRMLRPPTIQGDLPVVHKHIRAVDGSAWLAPDGSVGVFLLNYDDKPHAFQWSVDLNEIVKIDASQTLRISSWTQDQGAKSVGQTPGGVITRKAKIEPWGLIALRLEKSKRSDLASPANAKTDSLEQIKTPQGCVPALEAERTESGWADRVIHEKTGIELVFIPGGKFTMGSDSPAPYEVAIAVPYYIGKTEVTNAQYRRFLKASGYDGTSDADRHYDLYLCHFRGKSLMSADDDYPVVWVSWHNAKAFCAWSGAAQRGSMGIRLPCRHDHPVPFRRRCVKVRPVRLGCAQQWRPDSPGRSEKAQRLGALRHARQRLGMGRGRLRLRPLSPSPDCPCDRRFGPH